MLSNEFVYRIGMDRHRERLRKAARNQKLSQTRQKQKRGNRFSSLLVWLGGRLVVWGRHLEDHYGAGPRPLHSGL